MGLKYTKRAMTSYEVHRFFHGLEVSFFPDTFYVYYNFSVNLTSGYLSWKKRSANSFSNKNNGLP